MTVENILHKHNLKSTGCRKLILSELLESKAALAESEMKASIPELFNRVTFYRTLRVRNVRDRTYIHISIAAGVMESFVCKIIYS